MTWLVSQATPFKGEKGSGRTPTIELSPQQKLAATNGICALHKWHLLSDHEVANYVTC